MSVAEHGPTRVSRRRGITLGLLRALAATSLLVTVYYLAPLANLEGTRLVVLLLVACVALVALTLHQVRAILRAAHPGVRAAEALATTVPLFLLLFSATYFLMSHADNGSFSAGARKAS